MGVEYQDLCDPYMVRSSGFVDCSFNHTVIADQRYGCDSVGQLAEDDEIFYGFWGNCVNSYRDSKHHRGYREALEICMSQILYDYLILQSIERRYSILSKWRSMVAGKPATTQEAIRSTFLRLKLAGALPAGVNVDSVTDVPFFVYTSNVERISWMCVARLSSRMLTKACRSVSRRWTRTSIESSSAMKSTRCMGMWSTGSVLGTLKPTQDLRAMARYGLFRQISASVLIPIQCARRVLRRRVAGYVASTDDRTCSCFTTGSGFRT